MPPWQLPPAAPALFYPLDLPAWPLKVFEGSTADLLSAHCMNPNIIGLTRAGILEELSKGWDLPYLPCKEMILT